MYTSDAGHGLPEAPRPTKGTHLGLRDVSSSVLNQVPPLQASDGIGTVYNLAALV